MIKGFADKLTADIYNGVNSAKARQFPSDVKQRAMDRLTALNAATSTDDLRVPPSNNLEQLKGDLAGSWSMRVNKQWRIVFKWDGGAVDVKLSKHYE